MCTYNTYLVWSQPETPKGLIDVFNIINGNELNWLIELRLLIKLKDFINEWRLYSYKTYYTVHFTVCV